MVNFIDDETDKSSETNEKKILSVNNFQNIMVNNDNIDDTINDNIDVNVAGNTNTLNELIVSEDNNNNIINNKSLEHPKDQVEDSLEVISESDVSEIKSESSENLLQGGDNTVNIEYTIDYILEDDDKLVNPETIFKNVDMYIDNYYSIEIEKYRKNFKQLYQTYSIKNYNITTVLENSKYKIIVKNEKTKKIVKELKKPLYLFYDDNNNLIKLKRQISNDRADLIYKYEKLIARLDVKPEDKKIFEKEKKKFIEILENYYTYTLYHKKINKINVLNKSSLVLQKELLVYNEHNDYEKKILNSNIYSLDTTIIEKINKYNYDNLLQYNNLAFTLSGKKDLVKEKKLTESIKVYLKHKTEIDKYTNSLYNNTNIQDEYINYIVLGLP